MISSKKVQIDLVGFWVSTLCALHCIAVPLLLTFSALGSLHFLANPTIELVALSFSVVVAFSSLLPSYLNKHRSKKPIVFMLAGLILIFSGRVFHDIELAEVGFTVMGAFLVAGAHLINWRLLKKVG